MNAAHRLTLTFASLALVGTACAGGDEPVAPPGTTAPAPGTLSATAAPDPTTSITTTTVAGTATPTTAAVEPPPEVQVGAFEVTTADGLTLEAERFGTGDEFVVLAHMRPADMTSWFSFAGLLAGEGYSALAFNFRGYGNSDGAGFAVDVDVEAVVDAAVGLGATKVYVIGASMGGSGSVVAASRRDVAGVVTLSAPADFLGANATEAASAVTVPMLLVAAEGDSPYNTDAETIESRSAGPAELLILTGRNHGTNMFQDHSEELTTAILEFLASA